MAGALWSWGTARPPRASAQPTELPEDVVAVFYDSLGPAELAALADHVGVRALLRAAIAAEDVLRAAEAAAAAPRPRGRSASPHRAY